MELVKGFRLSMLVEQTSKTLLKRIIATFKNDKKDDKITTILWKNLVASIHLQRKQFGEAEIFIDEVLRIDPSNIHALCNFVNLSQARHDKELENSAIERLSRALECRNNILIAKSHFGYYLTMVGAPESVPAFDSSFETFDSVISDAGFRDLPEEDQFLCHWLYAKVLIRTGLAVNSDHSNLPKKEKVTRALTQLQKLKQSNHRFFVSQQWIWQAELRERFPDLMGRETPSIQECIDEALKTCDSDDGNVLARISKLYVHMLDKCSTSDRKTLYCKIQAYNERALRNNWTVMAASNASLLLHHQWMDSYAKDNRKALEKKLRDLQKHATARPVWDLRKLLNQRPVEDKHHEVRKDLLEESRGHLEDIVGFLKDDSVYNIQLARVKFALGHDFRIVRDILASLASHSDWKLMCDAYQMWGSCLQHRGDELDAERKFTEVLRLASGKKYKPLIAVEEMECILKKRLKTCEVEEQDEIYLELVNIYHCIGTNGMMREAKCILNKIGNPQEKIRNLLVHSLQAKDPFEAYIHAEDLLRWRSGFRPQEFIEVCLRIGSIETSMDKCWYIFPKVIKLYFDEIVHKTERANRDLLVFHGDTVSTSVICWIDQMKNVFDIDISSADSLQCASPYTSDRVEELLTGTSCIIVFLDEDILQTDEWQFINHLSRTFELGVKMWIFFWCDSHIQNVPAHAHRFKIQESDIGSNLCTKHLASALVQDIVNCGDEQTQNLIDKITNLKLT